MQEKGQERSKNKEDLKRKVELTYHTDSAPQPEWFTQVSICYFSLF